MIFDIDAYNTISVSFSEKEAKALVGMIEDAKLPERRLFNSLKEQIKKELKF